MSKAERFAGKEAPMRMDNQVSVQRINADLRVLSVDIGERLAGTEGEQEAARYVQEQLSLSGAKVQVETFLVHARL